MILFITQDELGMTALSAACQQGHVNIVRLLINNGANVDFQHKVNKWLVIGATCTLIILHLYFRMGELVSCGLVTMVTSML